MQGGTHCQHGAAVSNRGGGVRCMAGPVHRLGWCRSAQIEILRTRQALRKFRCNLTLEAPLTLHYSAGGCGAADPLVFVILAH